MRIQNNIMAINAYRNYNNNTGALSKNLEKLSSGYRINRAGDDAAGLAISEKMRAQITGLDAAQKNVKDGISLVKTAEGAMQEIQDMLNRVKYLATQSANGTYDDGVDRAALQDELDALTSEIDRIADSANFNGTKLLDGSLDTSVSGKATQAATATKAAVNLKFTHEGEKASDVAITLASGATAKASYASGGKKLTITLDGAKEYSANDIQKLINKAIETAGSKATDALKSVKVTGSVKGSTGTKMFAGDVTLTKAGGEALSLQIGDDGNDYNQIDVGVASMKAEDLGVKGLDISTKDNAKAAIDGVVAIINSVSSTRGKLGAIQNRLEHTTNNLSVMAENIQDAESNIRDTDVADEMMAYTKNNILIQSAQAMLAQANTIPQGVLQLLG